MMAVPISLLIADDTDAVRRAIRMLLAHEASITICGEARNFVELFSLLGECNPDVILMDLHMPDERQYDSARIKSRLRGHCLLAMSIWDDEITVRLADSFGTFKLLNKANLAFVLTPTIKECAEEKRRARA